MRGYYAFVKKELTESLKSYRALILLAVFFVFGMMSPLLAKLTPEILASMAIEGVSITVPEPTAVDAYSQLFKNLTQMGMVVLLLVFGGMLSNEIARGTLLNMLTKGLSRHAVILAKYTVAVLLWTAALTLSALTTYGYTVYLFGNGVIDHLLFALIGFWLFGAFVLAFILLSSAVIKGSFGGLILTAVTLLVLLLLNIAPALVKWNPISLASSYMGLFLGGVTVESLFPAVGVTVVATVASLGLAMFLFGKSNL